MSDAPPDDGPWNDYREVYAASVGPAGTTYTNEGARLAGPGPMQASEILDTMPHRLVLGVKPRTTDFAALGLDDCLWLLPDTFGTPPVLPMSALRPLAIFIQAGGSVGMASRDLDTLALAYNELVRLAWGPHIDPAAENVQGAQVHRLLTEKPAGRA